jgi:MFS family permease
MSPFYPIKATQIGVSKIQIGYIFSVMAFGQIVSSFIVGKFMHYVKGGRHQIILLGSILIIAQTVMLGTLEWITDLH